ncbi:MAG: glycosyltransferase family 2 protein [Pseudomonadota bacterium]
MTTTLLATMRDEAPFILEWVAYHRLIGFEKIIVFSNDCTDGTDEILNALHAIEAISHVAHEPDPTIKVAEQVGRHVLNNGMIAPGDWMIWLDADEFLNIHLGDGYTSDLITYLQKHDAQGMCISWRVFGDAAQERFEGMFLAEPFTRAAAEGEAWQNVKTIFQYSDKVTELFQHKPIFSPTFWSEGGTFQSSKPMMMQRDNRLAQQWVKGFKRGKITPEEAGWGAAQINHYAVRTRPLFAFKQARGRIGEANEGGKQRYNRAYFNGLNLNTAHDDSILKWTTPLRSEMASLADQLTAHCNLEAVLRRTYAEFIDVK